METVIEVLEIGKSETLKEINKIEMYYATGSSPLNINALNKLIEDKRNKIKDIEIVIQSLKDKPILNLKTEPGLISTIRYKDKIISFQIEELEEFLKNKFAESLNKKD